MSMICEGFDFYPFGPYPYTTVDSTGVCVFLTCIKLDKAVIVNE